MHECFKIIVHSIFSSLLIQKVSSVRGVSESAAESLCEGSSGSSLPSIMSEVRGDWGAVTRLKSSHRVSEKFHSDTSYVVIELLQ